MLDDDEKESRRVVVLGVESRDQLFPGKPAIGETLTMSGVPIPSSACSKRRSRTAATAAGRTIRSCSCRIRRWRVIFLHPKSPAIFKGWINNLVVEVVDPNQHEAAMKQVYRMLAGSTISNPTTKTLSSSGIRSTARNWWNTSSAS